MLTRRAARSSRRPRPRDDGGSTMIIVLVAVIVLTALVGAIASDTLLSIRRSSGGGAGDAATAAAELAVAEATARIELGATTDFTGTVTVDGGAATYTAVRVDANSWDITAEGDVGAQRRALSVGLGREARFPFALFVDEQVELRNPVGVVTGRVGTNGTMDITGLAPGTTQELYRPAGTCTGCAAPVVRDGPYRLSSPTVPATTQPCPASGHFELLVDGGGGTPYLCDNPAVPVSFGIATVTNGPLVVIVGPGVPLSLTAAAVNVGGAPDQFQLYKLENPTGSPATVTADGAVMAGLLHAPRSSLTTTSLTVVGSVVLDRLTVPLGGTLAVVHAPELAAIAQADWGITRWSEVGAG